MGDVPVHGLVQQTGRLSWYRNEVLLDGKRRRGDAFWNMCCNGISNIGQGTAAYSSAESLCSVIFYNMVAYLASNFYGSQRGHFSVSSS